MGKQTQLDKILVGIDAEIAVLEAARARLIAQQVKAPAKKKATRPIAAPDLKAV